MLGIEIGTAYLSRMAIRADFDCHNRWGIDRSGEDHIIILVSDPSKVRRHRYRDALMADGRFRFYGQAPRDGDPNANNNHMVRNHIEGGDSLELFIKEGEIYVYRGEWVLDEENALRNGQVVFYLRRHEMNGQAIFDQAVEEFRNDPDLRELAYQAADENPARRGRATSVFRRSAIIVAHALNRAGDECEYRECEAPFEKPDETKYLEVHHIDRLADGGPDHPMNVAALCPNCHKELHFGTERVRKNAELRGIIQTRERNDLRDG
ncbi:HNH endonuclease [Rhizobium sp. ARZ01]|uniref:HNH endonuclease n=1 Tax=Rhizobium sp. ARZ01 TaxID=2769313 RepID=UPI00177DA05B|nr:HNH endonuclease [Rhizobium sp. ARZ01]MBD9372789.1 HNH endonuclease [Rhizobium sp. ARZ01]